MRAKPDDAHRNGKVKKCSPILGNDHLAEQLVSVNICKRSAGAVIGQEFDFELRVFGWRPGLCS